MVKTRFVGIPRRARPCTTEGGRSLSGCPKRDQQGGYQAENASRPNSLLRKLSQGTRLHDLSPLQPREPLSDREFRIPLKDLHFELWSFAGFPDCSAGPYPVLERTSICALAALKWTRNTDELRFEPVGCDPYDRVAVAAHIDKRNVGRQVRVRQRASSLYISSLRIFQA
jgi:hypothetical protein